jgi:hypothetical protein
VLSPLTSSALGTLGTHADVIVRRARRLGQLQAEQLASEKDKKKMEDEIHRRHTRTPVQVWLAVRTFSMSHSLTLVLVVLG